MKHALLFSLGLLLVLQSSYGQGALRDSSGNMMRGTPMVLAKNLPDTVAFAENINNWYTLKNNGLNTVRLCCVDPWYRDHGYPYWTPQEVRTHIDRCIANANTVGMNVIINYHNINEQGIGNWNYNFSPVNAFWAEIAWRYKDNRRVYYELVNEPTFNGNDYTHPDFKSGLLGLYRQVRAAAPNSHIIMFSFNSLGHDIVGITRNYREVDWRNASVGFHSYSGNSSGDKIGEIMKTYRVICTEWDYAGSFDYVLPVDGYWQNGEAWERKGVSWIDWRNWDDNSFNKLLGIFIPDAKAKGYWWGGSTPSAAYRLRCKWGNLYLSGSNVAWNTVSVASLNNTWTSQQWTLEAVSPNTYRLKCKWGGLYLNGNQTAWTNLQMSPKQNWTSQMWTFEKVSGNEYRLRCNYGNTYLSGNNVSWTAAQNGVYNATWTSQIWVLETVGK